MILNKFFNLRKRSNLILATIFFLTLSCVPQAQKDEEKEQKYIDNLYQRLLRDLENISSKRKRHHSKINMFDRPVWNEYKKLSEEQNKHLMLKLNQNFKSEDITKRNEALAIVLHINTVLQQNDKTLEVIPSLIDLLNKSEYLVQYKTIETLGDYGETAKSAVPILIAFINSKKEFIRSTSIESLGKIGSASLPAVPHIIKALKDESSAIRWHAAIALSQIDKSEESAKELIFLLEDKDSDVCTSAIEALGNIGKNATKFQEFLLPYLQDKDEYVRLLAEESLGKIGQRSELILDSLVQMLKKEKNDAIKQNIVRVLGNLAKPQDKKVLEILEYETHNKNIYVQKDAKEALEKIKVK